MAPTVSRFSVIVPIRIFLLFLGCVSCLGEELAGKWEGTYREDRRIVVFRIEFESETRGTLQVLGQEIGIAAARGKDGSVELHATDNDPISFFGRQTGDTIVGELRYRSTTLPFRMEREPLLPQPNGRVEAWHQDLDYLQRRLLLLETSFTSFSRQQFVDSIAGLKASAVSVDDPHMIVGLARIIAVIGNAHTRLYLLRNRTDLRRLPVRVWWFQDKLHIIRTGPEQTSLLGCEVLRIGNVPATQAKQIVAALYAGSEGWRDYMSTYTLTSPEVLYGADVASGMESIPWQLKCDARTVSIELKPLPLKRSTVPVESWWDLAPEAPETMENSKPVSLPELPMYLKHPNRFYWFTHLPEIPLLYLQYNRSSADRDHPLAPFTQELLQTLADHPRATLVIDLRFNTGGDGNIGRQMMESIQNESQSRKVYIITGRATFSAGLFHAVQWKHWGKAIFVGEEVGDSLEFLAEGGNFLLPNSKLTVHFANARHCYSAASKTPSSDCFNELRVASLGIDLPASNSFDQYRFGRDAAFDSILADLKRLAATKKVR